MFGLEYIFNQIFSPGTRTVRVANQDSSGNAWTNANPLPVSSSLPKYQSPSSGEVAGSAVAAQMPNVACALVKFKAQYNNAGRVYLGILGVTKADGASDATTGLQLSASEETGWIPVDNLNRFWYICDNAGDAVTYLVIL